MIQIDRNSVHDALFRKFATPINSFDYQLELLQGGTVGEVFKVFGEVSISAGSLPFSFIVKNQEQWERFGDSDCWRREYAIFYNKMPEILPNTFRMPTCYLLIDHSSETQIWMEFVEGKTGYNEFSCEDFKRIARELGEFQASVSLSQVPELPYIRCFPAVHSSFALWWGRIQKVLESQADEFPDTIRQHLYNYGLDAESHFERIRNLPKTLCHGDFHEGNIIISNESNESDLYLIDWDCAGYGYIGEDIVDLLMEAFVYTDRDVSMFQEYESCIVEAYRHGLRLADTNYTIDNDAFITILTLTWGFRIVALYLRTEDPIKKSRYIKLLEVIMRLPKDG